MSYLLLYYVIFFLMSETLEALYFAELDVTEFVECFENLEKDHEISE